MWVGSYVNNIFIYSHGRRCLPKEIQVSDIKFFPYYWVHIDPKLMFWVDDSIKSKIIHGISEVNNDNNIIISIIYIRRILFNIYIQSNNTIDLDTLYMYIMYHPYSLNSIIKNYVTSDKIIYIDII